MRTSALGRRGSVNEALVSKPLPPNKFLGEVARVDRAGRAMYSFREHVHFHGKEDEVGGEFLGCNDR